MNELHHNRPRLFKALWVFLLAISAFNLGRYSVEFSGRLSAWLTVIGGIVVLISTASLLVFVAVSTPRNGETSK